MRTLNISLLTLAITGLALSSLAISGNQMSKRITVGKIENVTTAPTIKTECLLPFGQNKSEVKKHKVRLKILNSDSMNPDFYLVKTAAATGEWGASYFLQEDEDPIYWQAEIPEGRSDLLFCFMECKDYDTKHLVYLVKKDIHVDKDMEITIDPEEASVQHIFSSFKSNGQELSLPLYRATENPDNPYVMDMELLEEGTVDNLTSKVLLCNEKEGPLLIFTSIQDCRIEGYASILEMMNCYTNNAEGYYVIQARAYQSGEETNEIVTLIPDNPNQLKVSNDVSDFFDIEIPLIEQTLAGKENEHQPAGGSFPEFEMIYNNKEIGSRDKLTGFIPGLLNAAKDQKNCRLIKACVPTETTLLKDLEMKFAPRSQDMMVRFLQDTIWWDDNNYQIIDRSQTVLDFGRVINVIPNQSISMNGRILGAFISTNKKITEQLPMPSHPYFPNYAQMKSLNYNTTQPYVTSIFSVTPEKNYHDYTFFDNYGGEISTYIYAQNYKLKYNDKLILDSESYDDLIDRFSALNQSLDIIRDSGTYELEMTTFTGDIGGVDSKTAFTAKFGGMGTDQTAPSLQILNFINREDKITNRFEKPEDGLIRLTGGDFELKHEGYNNTDAFVKTDETVTPVIECSAFGKNDWQALNPTLQSIETDIAYGDSWIVELNDMNIENENSWYDLKITMTDSTGNSLSQVISPAFYIGEGSSVELTHDDTAIYVEGNNLYGPEDMQVFGVDGRIYSTKGLPAGIYVARSGKTTKKVIIR